MLSRKSRPFKTFPEIPGLFLFENFLQSPSANQKLQSHSFALNKKIHSTFQEKFNNNNNKKEENFGIKTEIPQPASVKSLNHNLSSEERYFPLFLKEHNNINPVLMYLPCSYFPTYGDNEHELTYFTQRIPIFIQEFLADELAEELFLKPLKQNNNNIFQNKNIFPIPPENFKTPRLKEFFEKYQTQKSSKEITRKQEEEEETPESIIKNKLNWRFTFNVYNSHTDEDGGETKKKPKKIKISGFPFHTDIPANGDITCIYSILREGKLQYVHPSNSEKKIDVVAPVSSLLVMSGEARYEWMHRVVPEEIDEVDYHSSEQQQQENSKVSRISLVLGCQ